MSRHPDPPAHRSRSLIRSIVPSIGGWHGFGGTFGNLALFGLAAVGGTWVVHQVEYAIEYRERFAAVMGSGPHRLYMGPLGDGLLIATLSLLATLLLFLLYAESLLAALCGHDRRRRRRFSVGPMRISWAGWFATGIALAALQVGLYTLQENLESLGWFGMWPGWSVLLAPQHATVLPLHFLVATGLSLILWTVSAVLRHTRLVVRWARRVAAYLYPRRSAPAIEVMYSYRPDRRAVQDVLAARPPPHVAMEFVA